MGATLARLIENPIHVVMLGLDSAGKSTILYRLKFDQYVNTVPTIGFNCEKVRGGIGTARGVNFTIWDVGGQDKVRPLWRSYIRSTDGIVFVVDSTDCERMEEAKVELLRTGRAVEALGVPLLVLANKQDLPASRDVDNVRRLIGVTELAAAGRPCAVHPVCAVTGEGLDEALEQLYQMIVKRRRTAKLANRKR